MVPAGMVCAPCGRTMEWTQAESSSRCITLQHDNDGTLRLICQRCNSRHRDIGDSFYGIKVGWKRCAGCDRDKPAAAFATDRAKVSGLKSRCRDCCVKFYNSNRQYWQVKNRESYQRRREARHGILG